MPSPPPTPVRYLVLAWFCAFAMLAYVQRFSLNVPAKEAASDLGIATADMGAILGMFFWGYAFLQVPGGWLGWWLGSRVVVPIVIVIGSVATALQGLDLGYEFLLGLRFVMGMAQAALFPCAVQSFARWFPANERATPSGWLAAFMSIGGATAYLLSGALLELLPWQTLMVLYAAPGLLCAIWFFAWFRDDPAQHPSVIAAKPSSWHEPVSKPGRSDTRFAPGTARGSSAVSASHPDTERPAASMIDSADTPDVRLAWHRSFLTLEAFWFTWSVLWVCLQQFCRAAAYGFFATVWPLFLQEARGFKVSDSGFVGSLPLWGVVLGSVSGGIVMDWIYRRTGSIGWSRRGAAVISLLGAGLFMLFGYLCADVWLTVLFLTLSSFCAGACGPAGYTATIDLGGRYVATVFSIMNMTGNIGAALVPPIVIWIKEEGTWDDALLLVGAFYLASVVCWLLIRLPGKKQETIA